MSELSVRAHFMPDQPTHTSKLYCYVDETGQDTLGRFFIVSIVVTGGDRDLLIEKLAAIERSSGKGQVKWMKVRGRQRLSYMQGVLSSPLFKGRLYFSQYKGTRAYMALTVLSTAKAILTAASPTQPQTTVYVDGLPKSRLRWFGTELRRLSVRTSGVIGVRKEEADALIRLADACCGFIRAALSGGHPEMTHLLESAKASGYFMEV